MQRPRMLAAVLVGALACSAGSVTAQQKPDRGFVESELPAPASELYELLAPAGSVSPRGTAAGAVEPGRVVTVAKAFLAGKDGQPKDPKEGAFWLRRAVEKAPDANARVFAIGRLGLVYANGEGVPVDIEAARRLWQIAGAMGDGGALYNLGQLAESEANSDKTTARLAVAWYQRALATGYDPERTNAALARLAKSP